MVLLAIHAEGRIPGALMLAAQNCPFIPSFLDRDYERDRALACKSDSVVFSETCVGRRCERESEAKVIGFWAILAFGHGLIRGKQTKQVDREARIYYLVQDHVGVYVSHQVNIEWDIGIANEGFQNVQVFRQEHVDYSSFENVRSTKVASRKDRNASVTQRHAGCAAMIKDHYR